MKITLNIEISSEEIKEFLERAPASGHQPPPPAADAWIGKQAVYIGNANAYDSPESELNQGDWYTVVSETGERINLRGISGWHLKTKFKLNQ